MMSISHTWNGVTASIYYLNRGEKVAGGAHAHAWEHTTGVISGSTKVTIGNSSFIGMSVGSIDITLPAGIPHEVEALEDNTIVIHMASPPPVDTSIPTETAPHGGVQMADGTVIPHVT